jgi:Kef-type K+ transport system membrane component KefB
MLGLATAGYGTEMVTITFGTVFYEVAGLLVLAAVTGLIGTWLRQPLIVAFIVVGIVAGPSVLGLAQSTTHIELLAKLGVALLLFLVGLQLDVKLVRTVGSVALVTGLGQVAFTSVIGLAICLALGLTLVGGIYVAVALTFSSTIIIVKLLSDKRELDSLHGRIALGFLIVQDLVVVFAMIVLSAVGIGRGQEPLTEILLVVLRGAVLVLIVGLTIRYVADRLIRRLAKVPELLVCFAIGWATLFASLGEYAGLSMELGGLLAGVALASTPYREAVASRLVSVRDFMLLFFFIALGSKLDLSVIGDQIVPAIVLSLFVLIGNPLIVMVIMGVMGYRKRTGFLAGLTVAQISEFSLVFAAMGLNLGDIDASAVGLVTLVGLVTIALSTYMILYSHRLYPWFEPVLGIFERRVPFREPQPDAHKAWEAYDAILFGLGRYGGDIARALRHQGMRVLGVDFDPAVVNAWRDQGFDVIYGDAGDPEFVARLPLDQAKWVVNAVHTPYEGPSVYDQRTALLDALRALRFPGKVALTAHDGRDAVRLRQAGANLVLMPFVDASKRAAELLVEDMASRAAVPHPGRSAGGGHAE